MKSNVIKKFRDKNDKQKDGKGKLYKVNSIFEASEERINELSKLGYVEKEKPQNDPRLDGKVEEVKATVEGLGKEDLENLLTEEKENKNRKGVIEHIEELIAAFEDESE